MRPCRRASHTTSYVSSAVSLANPRASSPPSQPEVFDDQLRDLSGRRPDVDPDCRLIPGRFLEVGELAVEHGRAHEVAVPCGQPRSDRLLGPSQKNECQSRTLPIDEIAVRALEGRARNESVFSSVKALLNPIGDLREPGPAVGVRKRPSCSHLLDVRLRVERVPLFDRPPQPAGNNRADRCFTAARHTHENQNAWFHLGDLKTPSALSAMAVIGLEQWHKHYRTACARLSVPSTSSRATRWRSTDMTPPSWRRPRSAP